MSQNFEGGRQKNMFLILYGVNAVVVPALKAFVRN